MPPLSRFLLIVVIAAASQAASADGNYLLDRCQAAIRFSESTDRERYRADAAYCFGLLQGIREMNTLYQNKYPQDAYFCLGSHRLSHSDSARLIVDYLTRHQDKLYRNESVLAVQALRESYPCRDLAEVRANP